MKKLKKLKKQKKQKNNEHFDLVAKIVFVTYCLFWPALSCDRRGDRVQVKVFRCVCETYMAAGCLSMLGLA